MNLKAKLGPLPRWVWLLLAAAVGYWLYRRHTSQAGSSAVATQSLVTSSQTPSEALGLVPSAGAPASIDMGTSWDCFDVLSHTYHSAISATAKANRQRLLGAMQAEGFRNYKREWWHFWLPLKRFSRGHDFPVE